MKIVLSLLTAVLFVMGASAQSAQKFNFDLEAGGSKESLAEGWLKWGNYGVGIDTLTAHSGKASGWVNSGKNGGSFGSIAYGIPAKYEGAEIQLEGFMKTEAVEEGSAGLLLRIDGSEGPLEFENMQQQNINGTTGWTKYVITLPYPKGAEMIYLGGLVVGKGKAWFDGFRLTIDGKDVQTLEETEMPVLRANLDREFDGGSRITLPKLDARLTEDLALLGRVWGFLKYHHPEVAKGNCNWDYELFRVLPQYVKISNASKRDQFLLDWIDSLGEVPQCNDCNQTGRNVYLKSDHSWMQDKKIGSSLKDELEHIYENRSQEEHFYIGFASGVKNPEFKNEKAYAHMPYPDDGFRLLTLFRYWNMIEYFFPNRHLTDKNWNTVLEEYLPVFADAGDELEYELAVVKLIAEIQDTHANLYSGGDKLNEWKGRYYAPVRVGFVEDKLVVTDFYNPELQTHTGMELGDVVTHINGKAVETILDSLSAYYPASNQPTRLRNISSDLLRSRDRQMSINFISEKGKQQKNLKLYERDSLNFYGWYRRDNTKSYKLLEDNIGYITLASIKDKDIPEIKKELKDTDGIVIDIRNYPAAFVPFSLGSWFASSEVPFVRFSNGSIKNPGEFTLTEPLNIPGTPGGYKGKLIVLLNEITQSQAEYTAMAFRAGDNTTIVGSTTAGADGNVSSISLPGGLGTMISGIGVYYPDGRETQRVGIVPDVEVKPSIAGIRAGRDELMEKAVELIKADRERR